ncbi:hypothetical protein H7H73_31650 [Mycobacterium rufum]|uniref:Beta-carotene 15,15'-dioxygenase n=1 Tax=Mycolicibacterium rufum TaxID=318424 RepID=A0A9X3BT74_9MYCO|nr:hypothetical protein [Mycolicibacterium rufum]
MSTSALSTAAVWSRRLAVGTVLVTGGHLIGVPALPSSVTLAIVGLGLIAGIPHGAVDHLTAPDSRVDDPSRSSPPATRRWRPWCGVLAALGPGPAALVASWCSARCTSGSANSR